jgi:hypothetical protein
MPSVLVATIPGRRQQALPQFKKGQRIRLFQQQLLLVQRAMWPMKNAVAVHESSADLLNP